MANFVQFGVLSIVGLLLALFACAQLGRLLGMRRLAKDPEGLPKGTGSTEAAVFGLLGLLLAFTFSGAASRFEERRHLVTTEANAIGTAYLRVNVLPADAQGPLRALFKEYLRNRIETYRHATDPAAASRGLKEGEALQSRLWTAGVEACRRPDALAQASVLLLPALNDAIDITTTRLMATRNHPPAIVYVLLVGLSLIAALLAGYADSPNKVRSWLHTVVFAITMSLAIYAIVDLEFPRLGLIRVDAADQVMVDLLASMR